MNEFLMAPHDFYQIILAALRYAYTRNNGLEPEGTIAHVQNYLPEVFKVDVNWALKIAQQAAEEAISELGLRYSIKKDPDADCFTKKLIYPSILGGREVVLDFIKWLVNFIQTNDKEAKYMPYNIGTYIDLSNDTF